MLEERESLWYRMLVAKYGNEGSQLCSRKGVGSIWGKNFNMIWEGIGLGVGRWLGDIIVHEVGVHKMGMTRRHSLQPNDVILHHQIQLLRLHL